MLRSSSKNELQNIHPAIPVYHNCSFTGDRPQFCMLLHHRGFTVNAFDRANSFLRRCSPIFGESNTRYDSNGPIENPPIESSRSRDRCWPADNFEHAIFFFFFACSFHGRRKWKDLCQGRNEESRGSRSILNGPTTSNTKIIRDIALRENLQLVN